MELFWSGIEFGGTVLDGTNDVLELGYLLPQ